MTGKFKKGKMMKTIADLDTPVVIVDIDRLENNINQLQAYLDQHGIANHPHIKTHKIPEIAHKRIRSGAAGITCQKLGEAEVMVQAGIQNILITYNLIGEPKLERLACLAKRATISVTADSAYTVQELSKASALASMEIPVLVEFDSGGNRCGVTHPKDAADLARLITKTPGVQFAGLMTYPTNEHSAPFVRQVKTLLKPHGITVKRVSGGGTPKMWAAHTWGEITEHRAGTYVYGDRHILKAGAMSLPNIALSVKCTVVSRPTPDRGIIDGGSKTFSSDLLDLSGYGFILEYPDAHFYGLSEEHGHVDFSRSQKKPEIAERVTVIPNHCCVVSNLFDQVVGIRNQKIEVVWPIAARGQVI